MQELKNEVPTVDLSVLATFSLKDLDVLKKLGIVPPKEKKTSKKEKPTKNPITLKNKASFKHTAPPEYYVQNTLECECCKSTEVRRGKMKQMDPKERFLRFNEEVIPEGEKFRARRLLRINCPKCYERLVQLSQHELALRVMYLVDKNARQPKEEA